MPSAAKAGFSFTSLSARNNNNLVYGELITTHLAGKDVFFQSLSEYDLADYAKADGMTNPSLTSKLVVSDN